MFRAAVLIAAIGATSASAAIGQAFPSTPPARIAVVDRGATIARDGRLMPAAADAPFVPGDRLRTTAGRVEVSFPDGTTLDVDEQSTVDLQSPTLLRLTAGRVLLTVWGADDPASAVRYQIDTQTASIWTATAGEYRVSAITGQVELDVLRGSAMLDTERGAMPLHAGEKAFARAGEPPSFPLPFNSAQADAFDRWAMDQEAARTSAVAVEDQPPVVQVYGGAQVINERCSLVSAPSLAAIAGRRPHRPASTPTIVMTAPMARPSAEPARAVTPPTAPVVVSHSTGAIAAFPRAPATARPQQPEPVPTPPYVVALPRVKMTPDAAAPPPPSHVAPSHAAPSPNAPSPNAPSHDAPSRDAPSHVARSVARRTATR
jgi:uncharacterized cupin superfamily protein